MRELRTGSVCWRNWQAAIDDGGHFFLKAQFQQLVGFCPATATASG
jgi:surfactin synthase thioesterase subunit